MHLLVCASQLTLRKVFWRFVALARSPDSIDAPGAGTGTDISLIPPGVGELLQFLWGGAFHDVRLLVRLSCYFNHRLNPRSQTSDRWCAKHCRCHPAPLDGKRKLKGRNVVRRAATAVLLLAGGTTPTGSRPGSSACRTSWALVRHQYPAASSAFAAAPRLRVPKTKSQPTNVLPPQGFVCSHSTRHRRGVLQHGRRAAVRPDEPGALHRGALSAVHDPGIVQQMWHRSHVGTVTRCSRHAWIEAKCESAQAEGDYLNSLGCLQAGDSCCQFQVDGAPEPSPKQGAVSMVVSQDASVQSTPSSSFSSQRFLLNSLKGAWHRPDTLAAACGRQSRLPHLPQA